MLDFIRRFTVIEYMSLFSFGVATAVGLKFATYPTLVILTFVIISMMIYKIFF